MVVKMAEGNPGAVHAISDIMKSSAGIDPQSVMPEIMPILSLDTHEIYGSSIHVLYKDKCGQDVRKVLVLLRAVQLGIMPEWKLQQLAADQSGELYLSKEAFDRIDRKVCEQLDQFQKPNQQAA
jgi:hypothetical protein